MDKFQNHSHLVSASAKKNTEWNGGLDRIKPLHKFTLQWHHLCATTTSEIVWHICFKWIQISKHLWVFHHYQLETPLNQQQVQRQKPSCSVCLGFSLCWYGHELWIIKEPCLNALPYVHGTSTASVAASEGSTAGSLEASWGTAMLGCPRKLVNGLKVGDDLLINGIYWGYNPLSNHLLTSWDIQVARTGLQLSILLNIWYCSPGTVRFSSLNTKLNSRKQQPNVQWQRNQRRNHF